MLFLLLSCSSHHPQLCFDPLGLEMIAIPKGIFEMGATAGEVDTFPIHKVEITNNYCMLSTEVTQKIWNLTSTKNTTSHTEQDLPIRNVTWFEAIAFANKLSTKANLSQCYDIPPYLTKANIDISQVHQEIPWNDDCNGYRLPTEAEWEFAARAGEKWNYSGGFNFDRYAIYKGNSQQRPHPVKTMSPNPYGLYDMSGNVAEWVWDGYGMYQENFVQNPKGSGNPKVRVSRGGGFSDPPELIRVDVRSADGPEWRFDWVGFRLLRNTE